MKRNSKALYEQIMRNVSREVKRTLNETRISDQKEHVYKPAPRQITQFNLQDIDTKLDQLRPDEIIEILWSPSILHQEEIDNNFRSWITFVAMQKRMSMKYMKDDYTTAYPWAMIKRNNARSYEPFSLWFPACDLLPKLKRILTKRVGTHVSVKFCGTKEEMIEALEYIQDNIEVLDNADYVQGARKYGGPTCHVYFSPEEAQGAAVDSLVKYDIKTTDEMISEIQDTIDAETQKYNAARQALLDKIQELDDKFNSSVEELQDQMREYQQED